MIRVHLSAGSSTLVDNGADSGPDSGLFRVRYAIAGEVVEVPEGISALEPFRLPAAAAAEPCLGRPPLGSRAMAPLPTAKDSARRTYAGGGWVGGVWRQVSAEWGELGYRVEVEGAGDFAISRDGGSILGRSSRPGELFAEEFIQALLGPALLLALASLGRFALHASAVATESGALVFLGSSGAGKSTLAADLAASRPDLFRHLCDDILPIYWPIHWPASASPGRPKAVPRFPQLKLARQPSLELPEEVPITGVYLLAGPPEVGEERQAVVRTPLSASEAAAALITHTVASRLFAPDLLARHLAVCARLAAALPVQRLAYPWHRNQVPEVAEALLEASGDAPADTC